jgi:hypothetical protein
MALRLVEPGGVAVENEDAVPSVMMTYPDVERVGDEMGWGERGHGLVIWW